MNDLLGDIKANGAEEDEGRARPPRRGRTKKINNPTYEGDNVQGDVEMGEAFVPPPSDQELAMSTFFAAVDEVKKDMAAIRAAQQDIMDMHERSKTLVKSKDVQKSRQKMQESIDEVTSLAYKVKKKIEGIDADNEAAKKLKGQGQGSASERTRTTVTAGLRKKFKEQMGEFSDLRNRIHEEYRELVERRMYTVTGKHLADEDVDKIIESGQAESIFQKAILTDQQGRGRVLDTMAEIQERHRAVKDLEQSLLELHQMFLDMATLVEEQGEMLDNIQKQVEKSVGYVQSGTQALQDAKQLQKKTRKMMCCALFIVLIVALIIVLAVVQPWKFTR